MRPKAGRRQNGRVCSLLLKNPGLPGFFFGPVDGKIGDTDFALREAA